MLATAIQLRNLIKITKIRKARSYEPYVFRWSFCLQQLASHVVSLWAASQCFQTARVANIPISLSYSYYNCVTLGRESRVHTACSMLLRMPLVEQRWNLQYVVKKQIWCLGNVLSCDGLTNVMLQWIWPGSHIKFHESEVVMIIFICGIYK